MNDGISPHEFDDYVGLLSRLLKLRVSQREAISEELRLHLEERFAALTEQGVAPREAISTALAEFGDAAALAAQFSSVARLRKRRWMMRFVMTSAVTVVVATMVAVSMWPSGAVQVGTAAAQTRQADKNQPVEDPEMIANAQTMAKLRKIGAFDFVDVTLGEVAKYVSDANEIQVIFNRRALEEYDVGEDLPITCTLRDVPTEMLLRRMLAEHELTYTIEHGVVIITTRDDADANRIIRVYRVDDLVRPGKRATAGYHAPSNSVAAVSNENPGNEQGGFGGGRDAGRVILASQLAQIQGGLGGGGDAGVGMTRRPTSTGNDDMDALIDLITRVVDPVTWEMLGGGGVIAEYRGALVITQPMHVHMKIEKLLDDLRRAIPTEDEQ